MTREDIIKAFEMRLDGMSYREIAAEFCVSDTLIRKNLHPEHGRGKHEFKCIFPGLTRWMNNHHYTVSKLAREMNISKSRSGLALKLSGIRAFSMNDVKSILTFTGLTFEEAFGEEVALGGEPNGCEQQTEGSAV